MLTRTWRSVAAAALAAVALAGCSDDRPAVVTGGDGRPSPSPSQTAEVGQPLTAADLPGWVDVDLPDGAEQSLVAPCGDPTGARDHQAAVRAAAVRTPTGITVVTQVADYAATAASTVVTQVISPALVACPAYLDGDDEVTVRSLPAPGGVTATGAEIVRTHPDGTRLVTVYWAALTGQGTVEVAVSARLGAIGTSPLEDFARHVLAAAQAKALGQPVGTVVAPALPEVLTSEQVQAQRDADAAAREQSTDPGAGGWDVPVDQEGFVPDTPLPDGQQLPPPPVIPDHGVVGETGPGTERGYASS